jgi:hypothetical protein
VLSPWPIRLPLWPGASDTFAPVWSVWLSNLVKEVNGPEPVVFASLPLTPRVGDLALVSDSNTAVWGAVIAGLGANQVLAWFNGVAWTVVGK